MDKISNVTYSVVCLVVIVLLVATVAVPVIENSQDQFTEEKNNVGNKYSIASTNEQIVVSIVSNAPAINGVAISTTYPDASASTAFVFSDVVMCHVSNGQAAWRIASPLMVDFENFTGTMTASDSITFNDGTVTIVMTDTNTVQHTYTSSYTYLMTLDNDGDYGAWLKSDLPIFVNNDAKIYVQGYSSTNNSISAQGTMNNLKTDYAFDSVVKNVKLTSTYEEGDESSKLQNVTSDVSGFLSGVTVVFAPIKYTVVSDEGSQYYVLLGILPLLLFMIPVIMAARLITRRD